MHLDEQQGIMGYWEPEIDADGITGVGALILSPVTKMKITNEQLLTQANTQNNEPFVYYTGACWNKANVITNASTWFDYLQAYKNYLALPLNVVVE